MVTTNTPTNKPTNAPTITPTPTNTATTTPTGTPTKTPTNAPTMTPTPTFTSLPLNGVTAATVGTDHTCALLTMRGATCWGRNLGGSIGDGTTTTRRLPAAVYGLSSSVTQISAGESHTCALLNTGCVQRWGEYPGSTVQLYVSVVPIQVSDLSSGVAHISARKLHSCARLSPGCLKCWGENQYGQLADGTTEYVQFTPVDARSG